MTYRCSYCDKVFCYKDSLKTHKKVKHAGVRYRCHLCIKAYTCRGMRKKHLEEEHGIIDIGIEKNLECPECGKTYAREDYLENHRKAEHLGVRFKCQFCTDKVFKYKRDLLRHTNRKHQEQKFKYEEMLKQGQDDWKYVVENKVPLDVLSEEKRHAVRQYLWHLTTNKIVYGDHYFTV